ncbi:MAG: hypothetical protein DWQ07_04365 [Chloroflexi bacterium]|nr:MAG: hypothetical protein DWQ07_04365 [Chloroflexota bacterium]MBL1194667.1 hypothetical protein [Chloroflexota bacterium]NOH11958.1 hypothetical protein [Chloroflexota bacterium]
MPTPEWVLWIAFWLHMLATVVWIGGLAALAILILPLARQSLDENAYATFLGRVHRRLDPIGWISIGLLTATGLVQMSANPNYDGFLAIDNPWASAILIKHILFFLMIGISAYLTWGLTPNLRRAALLRARGKDALDEARLKKQEEQLLYANLALGIFVLVLTAIARVA